MAKRLLTKFCRGWPMAKRLPTNFFADSPPFGPFLAPRLGFSADRGASRRLGCDF
jgi:hypothetical protein